MIKYILIVLLVVLFLSLLLGIAYVLSTMCRRGHKGLRKLRGWAYAHRGLHGDGVPENSLEAFRRAKRAGYGVELDVHLLSDGNLAVIHDYLLERTTGAKGYVEDLTTEQLAEHKLEGTAYCIPTFQQVLDLFDGEVPMIVELKCHKDNFAQLCEKACQLLDSYNGVYCLESFDPRCIRWLRKNRPELIRGQLTENYFDSKSAKLPWFLKFMLIHQALNFFTLPDFVAYRFCDRKTFSNILVEKLWGAKSVAWTLKTQEEYDMALAEGRIPIFEGFCP